MPRPISATISISSLSHNLHTVIQQLQPDSGHASQPRPKVWAVIKANAYGHDIASAVSAFHEAEGLAMLDLDEALRCRELGWRKPILLLEGCFEPGDIQLAQAHDLTLAIHCKEQLDMLAASTATSPGLDAYVKLNTGMNRLGFSLQDFPQAYREAMMLREQGVLRHVGKMTHFARADDDPEETRQQLETFNTVTAGLPGSISVCNSAATLTSGLWVKAAGDEQWVRPGICLYGSSPFADVTAGQLGLRPAMTLAAQLISVRSVDTGGAIGYGHTFRCVEPVRVGVVACGYADGYPRHAGTGTPITVAGVRTRLLGRISMDMLVADLTPVPHAAVGSPVVLWGEGGPSVDEVAAAAGTIGYELLCAVAPRVPKHIV
ncbi:alanine racemase [Pollutimonas thiosulfatoxidans]|uniref:Alanine racemase n=1 Tax=Pollutimonas thiosulfatoxidans TaxID=2028345 RepID=A0A410GBT1_9BURK|nr:alanine racemase [Pollutimonas thiosulfatoxidans]QAA93752.1 alanine racemase [Pollutimonas thiosulfatoxidans]